ncbi:MAG: peptidyl-prolyl cis-trans isomerase [Syntrophotaleaceae bacterium]
MRGFLLSLTICLLLSALPARAEVVSRIAAVVNDDIITTLQLDERIAAELGAEAVAAMAAPERLLVLDKMVEESLVEQRVKQLGMQIGDEELERAIDDVQRQNNIDRSQLEQALQAQGLTMETYRTQLRKQLLQFKLVGREIRDKTEVTNQETRDYYREHIEDYRENPYIRLSRISFFVPTNSAPDQVSALRALSQQAQIRLRGGEDFEQVLADYQGDKGAEGGPMGQFGPGELTEPFASAVEGLLPGQYSEVIDTPQGFHILRLNELNPGQVADFESVKEQIAKQLIEQKREEALGGWMEELKKAAHIEIKL